MATSNPSGANRVLIGLIGLLTLAVGILALLLSTGLVAGLQRLLGLDLALATPADPIWPVWARLTDTGALLAIAGAALVLAVLSVVWLLRQVPSVRATRPFRLDTRGLPGSAVVEPAALEDAVTEQLLEHPGVASARVRLRGAAAEPQVYIRLLAEERADLPAIMEHVHTTVIDDLSTALQVGVDRVGLTLDLGPQRRSDGGAELTGDVRSVPPARR